MKKCICIISTLAMLVLLGACSGGAGNGKDTTGTTTAQSNTVTTTNTSVSTTKEGSSGTTLPGDTDILPTGTPVEVVTDKEGLPVDSQVEGTIGKIFNSDKYSLKFIAKGNLGSGDTAMPLTLIVSGKKKLIKTSTDIGTGKTMEANILYNGKDTYCIMPNFSFSELNIKSKNVYFKIPASEADTFNEVFAEMDIGKTANKKYLGTTKVISNGTQYICESYSSEGTTLKFYISQGELKRIEIIDSAGSVSILDNIEYSTTVDETVFNLPKGYLDISALFNGAGGLDLFG